MQQGNLKPRILPGFKHRFLYKLNPRCYLRPRLFVYYGMTSQPESASKILIANRGEIAIRILRAAVELKLQTVAIHTYEDRYSLHRYKADETFQIGKDGESVQPYLDIDEIVHLAKKKNVDLIHPGYGFLSENVAFAERCRDEGITFVGPSPEAMHKLGDKIQAKRIARDAGVPVIEDSREALIDLPVALREAKRIGFPIILKAAGGGGGRGMRVVRSEAELRAAFLSARSEAKKAFGNDTLFMEKFIDEPKHLEVQILGDNYGNILHLFDRDCSVQRRFQKIVEIAPSPNLPNGSREKLYDYALRIARSVGYSNAGTVEFLLDKDGNIYFIEVNPRIQVEHTVTEEVTGVDLVRSQILIALGHRLDHPAIGLENQQSVECRGFAIQCRVTTEDPLNDFTPSYGRIIAYRPPGGFGVRLDAGNAYTGATVSPFFDSLLLKLIAWGRTMPDAAARLHRTLQEFRVRGVRTNGAFLRNVIAHPVFQEGKATVNFIQSHPELLQFRRGADRANKVLRYLGDVIVNGNPDVKYADPKKKLLQPRVPEHDKYSAFPDGTKQKLSELGPEKFMAWLKSCGTIQYTDTTFRDAHQSLLATRVRTIDLLLIAESFSKHHPQTFSMEVWGGATFDVALRFLRECPWERLKLIRQAVPNILLQMLMRGSNAVGYSAYPDNLIEMFIEKAWETGIDIFRIFDSMNWLEAMKASIRAVRERTGGIAEACFCYTGDILDPNRSKYTLQYYLDLARALEDQGAHMLGIKDMAGLLKPAAAELLIGKLKESVALPIHLHTHDTSSIQAATYLKAVEAGVDVVDVALGAMSGLTSQPNFNSIIAMMRGHPRELAFNLNSLNEFSGYWERVREYYYPFESELKAGTAEVYTHEIPGGQYSNLRPQARALGLEEKFETIKANYTAVNQLLGDVVKVTPSSKVVGDFALFLTSNNLSIDDVLARGVDLSFPSSLKSYFKGELGQPYGGFPENVQRLVLKGEEPLKGRPNENLLPVNFEKEYAEFRNQFDEANTFLDFLSCALYPEVFKSYHEHLKQFGKVGVIPTPAFFFGLRSNEEVAVEIAPGKTLIVKMLYVGDPDESGQRMVFFELNGQTRGISVKDKSLKTSKVAHRKAGAPHEVGSPLQGKVSKLLVAKGTFVKKSDPLFTIEAMKMETTVIAPLQGRVSEIVLGEGTMVQQDDLVMELESI